ncbi:MAG: hypothetical protein COB78_12455 [Hyphomicrobiales bacterium]|nr:MAG: hypothetical protein COB78_12455 [Hyphomicrobiales bacterium]
MPEKLPDFFSDTGFAGAAFAPVPLAAAGFDAVFVSGIPDEDLASLADEGFLFASRSIVLAALVPRRADEAGFFLLLFEVAITFLSVSSQRLLFLMLAPV